MEGRRGGGGEGGVGGRWGGVLRERGRRGTQRGRIKGGSPILFPTVAISSLLMQFAFPAPGCLSSPARNGLSSASGYLFAPARDGHSSAPGSTSSSSSSPAHNPCAGAATVLRTSTPPFASNLPCPAIFACAATFPCVPMVPCAAVVSCGSTISCAATIPCATPMSCGGARGVEAFVGGQSGGLGGILGCLWLADFLDLRLRSTSTRGRALISLALRGHALTQGKQNWGVAVDFLLPRELEGRRGL